VDAAINTSVREIHVVMQNFPFLRISTLNQSAFFPEICSVFLEASGDDVYTLFVSYKLECVFSCKNHQVLLFELSCCRNYTRNGCR
jgi:hypothetical protein